MRFRTPSGGLTNTAWVAIAVVCGLILIAVSGLHGSGHSAGLPAYAPKNAVAGEFGGAPNDLMCGSWDCTSPDAARGLKATDVFCNWKGDHVWVHVKLKNTMNARVHLSIVPKYFLDRGGQHGTSFGSDVPITLQPQQTALWQADAGKPSGVRPQLAISDCTPRLEDIRIG